MGSLVNTLYASQVLLISIKPMIPRAMLGISSKSPAMLASLERVHGLNVHSLISKGSLLDPEILSTPCPVAALPPPWSSTAPYSETKIIGPWPHAASICSNVGFTSVYEINWSQSKIVAIMSSTMAFALLRRPPLFLVAFHRLASFTLA